MINATKSANYYMKLLDIIYGQNLSDWDQLITYLEELNDTKLTNYAFDHAYLITQFLNKNRRDYSRN